MKIKRVYRIPLPQMGSAIGVVRSAGVPDEDIALIARSDIEMETIPEQFRNASTDFVPAALKGAATGGTAGLVAGLVALAVPTFGVTLIGAAAIAAAGVAAGTFSSALVGSSLPDPVRRTFEDEIKAGNVLMTVDAAEENLPRIEAALLAVGATVLPFEESSALT
ncbi:hypothetical protein [Arenimonas sp. MALMAid1274]|uniref:hypothetical protein n=1 Tax=Arenimonas sp. MALMAid1274 TaxID=3411630 RepID=UPI003BA344CD